MFAGIQAQDTPTPPRSYRKMPNVVGYRRRISQSGTIWT